MYWKFDNGRWYYGEIIKYNPAEEAVEGNSDGGDGSSSYVGDGGYTIQWEDGSVDHNTWDDDIIQQMIENYNGLWTVGQSVYEYQPTEREGKIVDISPDGFTYNIRWSNDNTVESIVTSVDGGARINLIVDNYIQHENIKGEEAYDVGTGVYWNFGNGKWLSGTITEYINEEKGYTITWENGDVDVGCCTGYHDTT